MRRSTPSCSTPRRATASTSRVRWRCCCAWAACRRGWRPGFSPGGFSKRRDAWIVRDTDAHAWVEAWYDELGWVTYDPTPDLTPARSQIAALEAPAAAAAAPGAEGDPASAAARPVAGGSAACGPTCCSTRSATTRSTERAPRRTAGSRGGRGCSRRSAAGRRRGRVRAASGAAARSARCRRATASVAELEAALRRAGRPLPTGTTLKQLEQRLGVSPDAAALPARDQRLPLRPGPAPADGGRAPGIPRGARPGPRLRRAVARALGTAAARQMSGTVPYVSAARRASWRISARMRSRRGSDERST